MMGWAERNSETVRQKLSYHVFTTICILCICCICFVIMANVLIPKILGAIDIFHFPFKNVPFCSPCLWILKKSQACFRLENLPLDISRPPDSNAIHIGQPIPVSHKFHFCSEKVPSWSKSYDS